MTILGILVVLLAASGLAMWYLLWHSINQEIARDRKTINFDYGSFNEV